MHAHKLVMRSSAASMLPLQHMVRTCQAHPAHANTAGMHQHKDSCGTFADVLFPATPYVTSCSIVTFRFTLDGKQRTSTIPILIT
jgi:hypothetical protein